MGEGWRNEEDASLSYSLLTCQSPVGHLGVTAFQFFCLPAYPNGGTCAPNLALPGSSSEGLCRAVEKNSAGPEDQLMSEPQAMGQDCACPRVFTGMQALSFPHLALSLSLFTENDCSYFCGESQESQVWRGKRGEVLSRVFFSALTCFQAREIPL